MVETNVVNQDIRDWANSYRGDPFHFSLGDWPYELSFMGKKWDSTGVSFQKETWEGIAEHIYPGGFIFAFGGSRTYHRLAVAAEDAGLIIHPAIVWLQGQGFPKATRVSKDGKYPEFEDHRYGLQALKPCAEFILVAQKPYAGKPVESIVATGAGTLWIDGGRVAATDFDPKDRVGAAKLMEDRPWQEEQRNNGRPRITEGNTQGRWPPNVALTHLPGCTQIGTRRVRGHRGYPNGPGGARSMAFSRDFQSAQGYRPDGDLFANEVEFSEKPREGYADPDGLEEVADWQCEPGCPVAELSAQSGERPTRFYPQSSWQYEIEEMIDGNPSFMYQAKASKKERNEGLNRFVWKKVGNEVVRIMSDRAIDEYWRWQEFGLPGKGFEKWLLNAEGKTRKVSRIPYIWGNIHPTQKPIELCRWLATLGLPPQEYAPRRILIPFFGKGSEAIGAVIAGWDSITGVEIEKDYADAGSVRLDYWVKRCITVRQAPLTTPA